MQWGEWHRCCDVALGYDGTSDGTSDHLLPDRSWLGGWGKGWYSNWRKTKPKTVDKGRGGRMDHCNVLKVTEPGNETPEPELVTIILTYFLFIVVDSQQLPPFLVTLFTVSSCFHNRSACLVPTVSNGRNGTRGKGPPPCLAPHPAWSGLRTDVSFECRGHQSSRLTKWLIELGFQKKGDPIFTKYLPCFGHCPGEKVGQTWLSGGIYLA